MSNLRALHSPHLNQSGRLNILFILIVLVIFSLASLINGFDDQERNLTFVKTDFQVL